jgi:hypothetical protein
MALKWALTEFNSNDNARRKRLMRGHVKNNSDCKRDTVFMTHDIVACVTGSQHPNVLYTLHSNTASTVSVRDIPSYDMCTEVTKHSTEVTQHRNGFQTLH